jgi:hypothetical protein
MAMPKELQYSARETGHGANAADAAWCRNPGAVTSMLILLSTLTYLSHQPTVQVILPEDT